MSSSIERRPSTGRVRIDPISLQFLVGVIEEGTIASVAERHHIAASAVSKRLSDLESLLGTSLIRRTNRGIEATAAGNVLLGLARGVLRELDEIFFQMREYSTGLRGQVRVLANLSSISGFLPSELKSFLDAHPQIHVQLEERMSPVVVRAIRENEADIGLFLKGDSSPGLEYRDYHDDQLVVVTPKGHPLERLSNVAFADTLEYDYIGLHEEAVLQLFREAENLRRQLHLRIQVSSCDALCAMVSAGMGIGVLPLNSVRPYVAGEKVSAITLSEPWSERKLMICMRSYNALSAAARSLVDHLARGRDRQPAPSEPG